MYVECNWRFIKVYFKLGSHYQDLKPAHGPPIQTQRTSSKDPSSEYLLHRSRQVTEYTSQGNQSRNKGGRGVRQMGKRKGEMMYTFLLFLTTSAMVSEAIWLNLPSSGTKCVSEEIQNNVVVLADYLVISEDHSFLPSISIKVCCCEFSLVPSNSLVFSPIFFMICKCVGSARFCCYRFCFKFNWKAWMEEYRML